MQLKDLAAALGISAAMVSKLKKRGMPTASVAAAEKWRRRHLEPARTKGVRAGSERETGGLPDTDTTGELAGDLVAAAEAAPAAADPPSPAPAAPADSGYSAARARREAAEADQAELELGKMRGELVYRADVIRGGFEVGREIRDTMEAAVNSLSAELANANTAEACAEILRRHNRAVCDALVRTWREKLGPLPDGGALA